VTYMRYARRAIRMVTVKVPAPTPLLSAGLNGADQSRGSGVAHRSPLNFNQPETILDSISVLIPKTREPRQTG